MKRRCDRTTTMSGKRSSQSKPTKSKEGVTITTEQEQTTKWVEHFRDILNRSPPTEMPNTTSNEGPLRNDNGNPPSKAEIERALKQLKNGKAAGPDGIPLKLLMYTQKPQQPCYTRFSSFRSGKWKMFLGNGRMAILSSCPKKGILGSVRIGGESCSSQFFVRFSAALS